MTDAKTTQPIDDALTFRLFNEIGIIAQLSATRAERVLPHGMTLAQFSVLNHCVRLGDGWTPARLAAAFQVTRGTMTSTLQQLEAKAFIRTEPSAKDARAKHVFLTPGGRDAREESIRAMAPQFAGIRDDLSTAEVDALLLTLSRLRSWLDAHR